MRPRGPLPFDCRRRPGSAPSPGCRADGAAAASFRADPLGLPAARWSQVEAHCYTSQNSRGSAASAELHPISHPPPPPPPEAPDNGGFNKEGEDYDCDSPHYKTLVAADPSKSMKSKSPPTVVKKSRCTLYKMKNSIKKLVGGSRKGKVTRRKKNKS